MSFLKRKWIRAIHKLISNIDKHNLFVLSSSVSYYTALALAPFLLIILSVSALIGKEVQENIIQQAEFIAPQAGQTVALVFSNINEQVDIGSISGIVGAIVLLFTASVVFVQLRYSLDIIYDDFDPNKSKGVWGVIKERIFLMLIVIILSGISISSMFVPIIFEYIFGMHASNTLWGSILLGYFNFIIFLLLFTGFYYFTPSKKQKLIDCMKISVVSSVGFILGKFLIGLYMKNFAAANVYGAAGALLVFLVWVYYSSFIIFLSVELFQLGRNRHTI